MSEINNQDDPTNLNLCPLQKNPETDI